MATIREIAKKANVSIATVSLVLNNKTGVSETTRDKIQCILDEEGYHKHLEKKAKGFENKVIQFIRISKHGHTVNRDHDVFISDYIDGITEIAIKNDYSFHTIKYEGTPIKTIVNNLSESNVDGAIVLGTELSKKDILEFDIINFPIVFIDTYYPYLNYDFVDMDNKDATYLAVKEFTNNGHTNIGIVSSPVNVENFHLRLSGFKKALKAEQLDKNFINIKVDSRYQTAYQDIISYIDRGGEIPSALFCVNDIIAFACSKALLDKGFSIPEDVSIIGFDNLSLGEMADPPLTTIDVAKTRIGNSAADLLIQRINSKNNFPPVKTSIGIKLVRRKSVLKLN